MSYEKLVVKRSQGYYANYDTKYIAELTHHGLNEHRVLVDRNNSILESKILTLANKWDAKWKKLCEKIEKEELLKDLEEKAEHQNSEVNRFLDDVENILLNTLEIDDTIDWETLKDNRVFKEEVPIKPIKPSKPTYPKKKNIDLQSLKEFPEKDDFKYRVKLSFFDRLLNRVDKKKDEKNKLFELDVSNIREANAKIESENKELINKNQSDYDKTCSGIDKRYNELLTRYDSEMKDYEIQLKEITKRKIEFNENKILVNQKVDTFKKKYQDLDVESIEQYCDLVLSNSIYPHSFPQSFEIEYSKENKSLIVDYRLPSPEDMPSIKEVRFIKSKKEIKEIPLSQSQINKLYDYSLYQICLRTIHELYEADVINGIDLITFNGFVKFINKSNGIEENSCIISLQVSKKEFIPIDLSRVDPKECFKGLKGVGSSKLHGLSAVKPIIMMERNDSRISESYSVVGDIDDSVNLAMMDWEDFENLVRELFAKEFTNEGAEVHVTQASRDGGVDAIAFDPDPIRGGKIVIQAKRYTNVVGVAAVRDLYGTVVNEGAIKGILVTTSEYGPESYNFAKNKPLTLLNGSNLLHMLMKHGTKAKIDIKEAKKYFKDHS